MREFSKNEIVLIHNLDDFSPGDFGMSDNEEMYNELLKHNNQLATITLTTEAGYYDVTCQDGFVFDALSDYHIRKIKLNEITI